MVTLARLAEIAGLHYGVTLQRYHRGWSVSRIITTPVHSRSLRPRQQCSAG
jgi:hypothetical protein